MQTDSYFEIGSTHGVCQDYALSGIINDKFAYAIITDGCSESHKICGEVDFGARVIAYAARDILRAICGNFNKFSFDDIRECIKNHTMKASESVRQQLGISPMFSDCTLLVAFAVGDNVYAYVYGDGGVIVQHKNGTITYDEISFLSSAPYYMTYTVDKDRNANYQSSFGSSPVIHTRYTIEDHDNIDDSKVEHNQAKAIDSELYKFSSFIFNDIESITVTSDGIKSYQSLNDGVKDVPVLKMATRFMGFKNKNGAFVQRRMKKIKDECIAEHLAHYDDVSVASIVI